ncbi:MAG: 4-vinyl reductase [Gemmatimonadota bacterium]|jgi:hypothetical protein
MESTVGAPREIAVPVSVFGSLRDELSKEAGTLPTVHALHSVGYQAGTAAAATLIDASRNGDTMGQDAFWQRISDFFRDRGWGEIRHEPVHGAIGFLTSSDWAEANPEEVDPDASCFFSTGFLSGLLSALAEGPVAVLEIGCRTRGEKHCRFAFGSEAAIHRLYGQLLDGVGLAEALDAL